MGCVYGLLYLLVVWRGVAGAGVGLGRLRGLCVRVVILTCCMAWGSRRWSRAGQVVWVVCTGCYTYLLYGVG